ncbi:hypothetical protein BY996DRAFT_6419207 [Phakopsora pachyrhizi]|nr:hypothetical protein BY996DRAFT_6419207 [Phakopsora pachyrhizi]
MNLVCKWSNPQCQKAFHTAEDLFSHLCDVHVGRKRHGNLTLTCGWEGCDHKAAKRDHMTSHMMVHCPLQTNVCGICEKTFKRSYDLRKHEVTHTAEHHQAHARSRAVIYKDLLLPFTSEYKNPASVNPSRVYKLPRGQSTEALGVPQQAPSSYGFRRVNSMTNTRVTPYDRPRREKTLSLSYHAEPTLHHSSLLQPQTLPEHANQPGRSISMDSLGSQFQFFDEYPNSLESPASDFPTSNLTPFSSGQSPQSIQALEYSTPNINYFGEYSCGSVDQNLNQQGLLVSTSASEFSESYNNQFIEALRLGSHQENFLDAKFSNAKNAIPDGQVFELDNSFPKQHPYGSFNSLESQPASNFFLPESLSYQQNNFGSSNIWDGSQNYSENMVLNQEMSFNNNPDFSNSEIGGPFEFGQMLNGVDQLVNENNLGFSNYFSNSGYAGFEMANNTTSTISTQEGKFFPRYIY